MSNNYHFLIIDGYPKESRDKFDEVGMRMAGILYADMTKKYLPSATYDISYISDPGISFPSNDKLKDYAGVLWPGCNLTIYDTKNTCVAQMIDLAKRAFEIGIPQFGSCWGIQIAVVAAGGEVKAHPKGREMGIARKIYLSDEGKKHPMYEGKPHVFDGFISHDDEITKLPESAVLLSSNDYTHVQAIAMKYKKGVFWATQYHPEYDLHEMSSLVLAREEKLIKLGFFNNSKDCKAYADKLDELFNEPDRKDLRWQLGIDDDVISDDIRQCEFKNWIEKVVLK